MPLALFRLEFAWLRSAAVATALLPLAAVGLTSPTTAYAASGCRSVVPHDVNGDGYAEVAVAEPGARSGAGAVHLLYGQSSGLVATPTRTALDDQYLSNDTLGLPGTSRDFFGAAVALGDFNDDGCADLAVATGARATPYRESVTVLYGSAAGLVTTGVRVITPGALSLPTGIEFGASLAVADLNGDGSDDLAIGAPGLHIGGADQGGGVVLLDGGTGGLPSTPSVILTRNTAGVPGQPPPRTASETRCRRAISTAMAARNSPSADLATSRRSREVRRGSVAAIRSRCAAMECRR